MPVPFHFNGSIFFNCRYIFHMGVKYVLGASMCVCARVKCDMRYQLMMMMMLTMTMLIPILIRKGKFTVSQGYLVVYMCFFNSRNAGSQNDAKRVSLLFNLFHFLCASRTHSQKSYIEKMLLCLHISYIKIKKKF